MTLDKKLWAQVDDIVLPTISTLYVLYVVNRSVTLRNVNKTTIVFQFSAHH